MKNDYKDKRDNTYGKFKRFEKQLCEHFKKGGLTYEEYNQLFERMRTDLNLDWEMHYDEWCRYVRSLGQSNHGKPKGKHNRCRYHKIFGQPGENKYKRFNAKLDSMSEEIIDMQNPQLSEFSEKELQAERDWILDVFDTSDYDKTSV